MTISHPITENLQILGLICDAVGITILGIPAMFRTVKEVASQMGTYFDFNMALGKALAESRVDISCGALVLIAGFVLQILGVVGAEVTNSVGTTILLTVGLFAAAYWFILRRKMADFIFKAASKMRKKQQEELEEAQQAANRDDGD